MAHLSRAARGCVHTARHTQEPRPLPAPAPPTTPSMSVSSTRSLSPILASALGRGGKGRAEGARQAQCHLLTLAETPAGCGTCQAWEAEARFGSRLAGSRHGRPACGRTPAFNRSPPSRGKPRASRRRKPAGRPPTRVIQFVLHALQDGRHPVLQALGPHQVLQLALTLRLRGRPGVAWQDRVGRRGKGRRSNGQTGPGPGGGKAPAWKLLTRRELCSSREWPGHAQAAPVARQHPGLTARVPLEKTMPTPRVSSWPSSLQGRMPK